jgi:hypothetical protein
MHRLFAYAAESDLADVEATLVGAFEAFVGSWGLEGVRLRNTKAPLMSGQNLPDWNIGLSVETSELSRRHIDQLLAFLENLSREVNLPFVVGTWSSRGASRDLCVVDRSVPDGAGGLILEGLNAL